MSRYPNRPPVFALLAELCVIEHGDLTGAGVVSQTRPVQTRARFFNNNLRATRRAVEEMRRDDVLGIESELLLADLEAATSATNAAKADRPARDSRLQMPSPTFDPQRAADIGAYVGKRWPAVVAFIAGAYPVPAADLSVAQPLRQLTEAAVFPRVGIVIALGLENVVSLTNSDDHHFILGTADQLSQLPVSLQMPVRREHTYLEAINQHNAALPASVVTQSLQVFEADFTPVNF